ncbi:MAG: 50S ribosomal protein L31 [Candidatus Marinimicrobia bacterium]|nr:50S ribosomal protein L31 [Candidatus Neomarinimicrobiota bacterium]
MKQGIHPDYDVVTVTCSCGNSFETKSAVGDLKVEICSECHPYFTGKQKVIDSAGRIDKFRLRYGGGEEKGGKKGKEKKKETKAKKSEAAAEKKETKSAKTETKSAKKEPKAEKKSEADKKDKAEAEE